MSDLEISIRYIGGNCPVQAEGTIGGKEFYFRARGSRWSMSIGGADVINRPEFYHEMDWGDGPHDAGWMPQHIALGLMAESFGIYAGRAADTGEDAP
ncbi:hypothetical protein EI545_18225 [Tabrizicola piscis]|uniref:Uncharacterized protein n=1 Tax=Tabrizicola piscis TaxID=2494374 RepID=A0A3S8UAI0_9RHOB|nr:hypothetical protein [Tabrizicola piscis]AZL60590.1 hypothetical protein EI545_18225 [Tabrizicola piscis]